MNKETRESLAKISKVVEENRGIQSKNLNESLLELKEKHDIIHSMVAPYRKTDTKWYYYLH